MFCKNINIVLKSNVFHPKNNTFQEIQFDNSIQFKCTPKKFKKICLGLT